MPELQNRPPNGLLFRRGPGGRRSTRRRPDGRKVPPNLRSSPLMPVAQPPHIPIAGGAKAESTPDDQYSEITRETQAREHWALRRLSHNAQRPSPPRQMAFLFKLQARCL